MCGCVIVQTESDLVFSDQYLLFWAGVFNLYTYILWTKGEIGT